MKKRNYIQGLLAGTLLLGLVGCGGAESAPSNVVVDTEEKVEVDVEMVDKEENVENKDLEVEKPEEKEEESQDKVEESQIKVEESEEKIEEVEDKVEESEDKAEESEDKAEESEDKVEEPEDKVEEPEDKAEESEDKVEEPEDKAEEAEEKAEEPEKKEPFSPSGNNTKDWQASHLYVPDDDLMEFIVMESRQNVTSPEQLFSLWEEACGVDTGAELLSFDGTTLDFTMEFQDFISRYGSSGEYMYINGLVNTFKVYETSSELYITIEGEIMVTGHSYYDFPL